MPLVFTTLLELTISKNCSWLEIEVDWINKMTPFKYICIGFLFGAHGEPHFYCMGIVNENSIWHQFISINFVQTNEILFVIWHLNAGLLVALQNAPDRSLIVVFTDNGTKVNSHKTVTAIWSIWCRIYSISVFGFYQGFISRICIKERNFVYLLTYLEVLSQ